jgi:hypothetical protein
MTTIHKSFLVSLAAFLGINIIFQLIGAALTGGFETLGNDPFIIVAWLFQGIVENLASAIGGILLASFDLISGGDVGNAAGQLLLVIGFLLAPVIATILAGYVAESKVDALGGWFLTIVLCSIVWTIFYVVDLGGVALEFGNAGKNLGSVYLGIEPEALTALWQILLVGIGSLVTVFSYGFLALAAQREAFY